MRRDRARPMRESDGDAAPEPPESRELDARLRGRRVEAPGAWGELEEVLGRELARRLVTSALEPDRRRR